jgi:ribosomal protein L16/L10AE
MLAPKRVLHRKVQRGSMKGHAKGNTLLYGDYGLQGSRSSLDHQPPDRGRSCRHHP